MSKRDIRSSVVFRVGENDDAYELFKKINRFRKLNGWTWRRICLMGIAEVVHDENPLLAQEIAELLIEDKRAT